MSYTGDDTGSVSMNFDDFISEQTDRIAGETQNYLNGIESPDVQLEFGGDYSSSVSMNFDKFFSEQTDRIAGETQSYLNGIESPDVQLTFGNKNNGGEDDGGGMTENLLKVWKEFKELDGKTQSVLASSLFSAIGGVMKNDTAKETNRLNQERLDLERQKQNNAMQSTAESYDKSKYKVRGLLNPEAKLTYSTQTGVKK